MVKRSTWVLLFIFLALVGLFLFLKYRPTPPAEGTPIAEVDQYLFSQSDSDLLYLRIFESTSSVAIERPSGGLWRVVQPYPGPADQAKSEAAATQATALLIVNTIKDAPPLSAMGLDNSSYIITMAFLNGDRHQIKIGNQSPSGSGYYVEVDGIDIYIISKSGIDALLNLHKIPPYPASTSTPVIDPESTLPSAVTTPEP